MLDSAHLAPGDYSLQPWKNGSGRTREIAIDSSQPFRWRLSWATVEASGPFSVFKGYDRSIVIWRGGPVALSHDGKAPRALRVMQTHNFKGEWETKAAVDSAAEDFNAFALRGQARVGVYPSHFRLDEDLQFPLAAHEHFLFGVEGEIEILEPNQSKTYRLNPSETVRVSRRGEDEYLNLRGRGKSPRASCLWVVVRHLDV